MVVRAQPHLWLQLALCCCSHLGECAGMSEGLQECGDAGAVGPQRRMHSGAVWALAILQLLGGAWGVCGSQSEHLLRNDAFSRTSVSSSLYYSQGPHGPRGSPMARVVETHGGNVDYWGSLPFPFPAVGRLSWIPADPGWASCLASFSFCASDVLCHFLLVSGVLS